MEPYWDIIKEIVRESDIVLEILDARSIEASRNQEIERIISEMKRPRIFVVNKADLVTRKDLEITIDQLKALSSEDVVYVSNKQKRTIKTLLAKIRQNFAKYGKREGFHENPLIKKPFREAKGDIIVGVVGYPNVGKSSIINSLCFKKKVKVSSKAGTTHGVHWITANKEIKLIDTPGVIPLGYKDEASLGMISSRNPERLKEPDVVAEKIITNFIEKNRLSKIEDFYSIKLEEKENASLIIEEIGKKKGHLRKGGLVDELRTAITIVRDWQTGKLKL